MEEELALFQPSCAPADPPEGQQGARNVGNRERKGETLDPHPEAVEHCGHHDVDRVLDHVDLKGRPRVAHGLERVDEQQVHAEARETEGERPQHVGHTVRSRSAERPVADEADDRAGEHRVADGSGHHHRKDRADAGGEPDPKASPSPIEVRLGQRRLEGRHDGDREHPVREQEERRVRRVVGRVVAVGSIGRVRNERQGDLVGHDVAHGPAGQPDELENGRMAGLPVPPQAHAEAAHRR